MASIGHRVWGFGFVPPCRLGGFRRSTPATAGEKLCSIFASDHVAVAAQQCPSSEFQTCAMSCGVSLVKPLACPTSAWPLLLQTHPTRLREAAGRILYPETAWRSNTAQLGELSVASYVLVGCNLFQRSRQAVELTSKTNETSVIDNA